MFFFLDYTMGFFHGLYNAFVSWIIQWAVS